MLVGLKNRFENYFKVGDFVYVYCYHNFQYSYTPIPPEVGYGVVVDTGSDYGENYEYLLASALIGVLINGKINWYSPNEILRVNTGDAC